MVLMLTLAACDTMREQPERIVPARPVSDIVSDTVVGTAEGAWQAVQIPFEDLNVKQQKIPEPLQAIRDNPYRMPLQVNCTDLREEIAVLDAVLGPDVCTPDNPTGEPASRKGEYIEKGAEFARDHGVSLVRSQAEFIPLRGVVRKISGAEKHANNVARAYEAGRLRRAFLKGVAALSGPSCLIPDKPAALAPHP